MLHKIILLMSKAQIATSYVDIHCVPQTKSFHFKTCRLTEVEGNNVIWFIRDTGNIYTIDVYRKNHV